MLKTERSGDIDLPARREVKQQRFLDEPCFDYFPAKHQAPLCWGCFLPIFGDRPDMFDGDLSTCSAEDEEDSFRGNTDRPSTHYPIPYCRSNTSVEHDNRGPQGTSIRRESSSLLVTLPSPVSCQAENGIFQETSSHHEAGAEEIWENDEPPELISSDTTSVRDLSSVAAADSHLFDAVDYSDAYTGDIINCNIVGGIKIQAVLHQAGMRIPFAATIPFPRADNPPFSGLEARPLSAEHEVLIRGKIQIGAQELPFNLSSVVQ